MRVVQEGEQYVTIRAGGHAWPDKISRRMR
jgi:hypothetical protein